MADIYGNPMDAAMSAVDIVMLIALFELRTGYSFPYDLIRDDVARIKASLLEAYKHES